MSASESYNLRDVFMDEMIRLARSDRRIVAVDCDVGSATRTWDFYKQYPDRFFEVGIAEQNAYGIAAGLASCGLIPLAATFATFASMRAAEIIRTSICYPRLNVKIMGGYAGLSNGKDGATHQSVEDIAIMRAIPNQSVICISDATIAIQAADVAFAYDGPVYIRMQFEETPKIYPDDFSLKMGEAYILREGKDVTLISCGTELHRNLAAAAELAQSGIDAEVIDVITVKPIDVNTICRSAAKTGRVVVLEEHNIVGGLGSAVCEVLMQNNVFAAYAGLGIRDVFTESGITSELRDKYDISTASVVREATRLIEAGRSAGGAL